MANLLSLHGLDPSETRRLHVGFSAGRFEFMARPYGIVPRNAIEEAAWPALRGQIFMEAAEIFLRLLRGDTINSTLIRDTVLTREHFRVMKIGWLFKRLQSNLRHSVNDLIR
jgi:hypothetical protein